MVVHSTKIKTKLLKLKALHTGETRDSMFKITFPFTSECFKVDCFTLSDVIFAVAVN